MSKRSSELVPTARSQRSRPDHKLLKTVTPERVHTTTVGDLLANRWQLAVQGAPGIEEAGCWTRPELLFCGGAPRRNRTGDPILTMEPPGTAVRTAVSPGHARPSGPKLSVLFQRSYALSFEPCADRSLEQAIIRTRRSRPGCLPMRMLGVADNGLGRRHATPDSESSRRTAASAAC